MEYQIVILALFVIIQWLWNSFEIFDKAIITLFITQQYNASILTSNYVNMALCNENYCSKSEIKYG